VLKFTDARLEEEWLTCCLDNRSLLNLPTVVCPFIWAVRGATSTFVSISSLKLPSTHLSFSLLSNKVSSLMSRLVWVSEFIDSQSVSNFNQSVFLTVLYFPYSALYSLFSLLYLCLKFCFLSLYLSPTYCSKQNLYYNNNIWLILVPGESWQRLPTSYTEKWLCLTIIAIVYRFSMLSCKCAAVKHCVSVFARTAVRGGRISRGSQTR